MNYQVISQIAQRLSQVTQLAWIDMDLGQLDPSGDGRPAVAFPACLVELAYPQSDNVAQYQQVVTCNVQLRLAFSPLNNPRLDGTTANHVAITDGVTPTIEAVHAALQGWETDSLSPLQRLTATPERRRDGIKVYRITYQTTFMETTSPLVVPDPDPEEPIA